MARERSRRTMPASHLGKTLGVSARRARAYWAEPRPQFEARSLAQRRPWDAEGISRSTWYRRRKTAMTMVSP